MAAEDVLQVLVLTPQRVIYEGRAASIVFPGEQGVFEILPHHRRLLSRLLQGSLVIDRQTYFVKRGVVKVDKNDVTVIVEE